MFRAFFGLFIITAAAAQTASPDAAALQALVTEIRQLRLDLQATTIATQRVQIVLYRLQAQTTLVARASSRLDDARSSLGNIQSEKKRLAAQAGQTEDHLKGEQNSSLRKQMEDNLVQIRAILERLSEDEQRLQSREIDAESNLRTEQSKLAEMQEQLDRLDKLLDGFTKK